MKGSIRPHNSDGTARKPLSGWQPIETAPRDGTKILLFTESQGVCEAYFSLGSRHVYHGDGYIEHEPHAWACCNDTFEIIVTEPSHEHEERGPDYPATHWMPLPGPPEGCPMAEEAAQ